MNAMCILSHMIYVAYGCMGGIGDQITQIQSVSYSMSFISIVNYECVLKDVLLCLSPGRRQAFIWTDARISLIRSLGTDFS